MKKVKIYTFPDKAPYFLPWQAKALKDHLKDDYEFIVINNASSESLDRDIKNHCSALAIQCIEAEQKDFSHQVFACSSPIQECIDKYISKDRDCINVIMDSDLFLMRDFSFNELMDGYDIGMLSQSRDLGAGFGLIEYAWNCLLCFNTTMPDVDKFKMWPGTINHAPCDVGGMSYFYFLYHPEVKIRKIPTTSIITNHTEVVELIPERVRHLYKFEWDMEIIEGSFLHFRGGSRWDNKPKVFYIEKEQFIQKLVKY